ncbi:hydrolase 1, exosortase A system-associated [Neptunicella sp. SCSIO 80796]|uniref:hydrolase 1, exosortase A system-associated n=1 Tax=Neptunicella plasticusilytica TaxID=3117012 RepID=UPI003A4D21A7
MESVINFKIQQLDALGILHRPQQAVKTAVLLVVGGPQYRVGSHRQFVQLSRYLANNNIISFRIDTRGMGDAAGDKQPFDQIDDDLRAATDCLLKTCPEIDNVVIWGLCDAASAALLYGYQDPRVSGLVLLNPWLKNEQAMAKSMVKHYYLQRLFSRNFWRKFLQGQVNVGGSLKEAKGIVASSVQKQTTELASYQQRMLDGAKAFSGPICLILSGNDLTAKEFSEQTASNKEWKRFVQQQCQTHHCEKADHTFSSREFKNRVEQITGQFVLSIEEGNGTR